MKKSLITSVLLLFTLSSSAQCFNAGNVYSFFYNGHSYKVVKETKTWLQASTCAVNDGGYLAEINDVAEQNALFTEITTNANIIESNTMNEFGTAAIWMGGSDELTEGTWIWDGNNDAVGTQFWNGGNNGNAVNNSYTNWGISPSEPDNSGGQNKLTLILKSTHPNYGMWNDLDGNNTIYYIIEYDQVLSIEENIIHENIKIYPNPFTENVFIENNSTNQISKINLHDIQGNLIQSNVDFENKLDLSFLKRGVYFLKIEFENKLILQKKVIKI